MFSKEIRFAAKKQPIFGAARSSGGKPTALTLNSEMALGALPMGTLATVPDTLSAADGNGDWFGQFIGDLALACA